MVYPAAQGCDLTLDAWCSANCPHAASHALVARLDTAHRSSTHAWRCYSPSTLDAAAMKYVHGQTYCTRDSALRSVLQQCLSTKQRQAAALQHDQPVMTVSLSPQGTAQEAAPHSGGMPPSSPHEHGGQRPKPTANPRAIFAAEAGAARVGLVVAHCHEQMHWLSDVEQGLRDGAGQVPLSLELYVYEKCGNTSEDACGLPCLPRHGSHFPSGSLQDSSTVAA